MYDIYLLECPNFSSDKELAKPTCEKFKPPCFLGLDMSAEEAANQHEKISLWGGQSIIARSEYRHPRISLETAAELAKVELNRRIAERYCSYEFNPMQYLKSESMYFLFGRFSEQLIQEGHTPGGVIAVIDKLDGHVWEARERKSMFGEEYFLEIATREDPNHISQRLLSRLSSSVDIEQQEDNSFLFKGKAIRIHIAQHKYPKLVQAKFGISPNVEIIFRLNPPQCRESFLLMLDIVLIVLEVPGDGILITENEELTVVFQRIDRKFVLNQSVRNWSKEELSKIPCDSKLATGVLPPVAKTRLMV